MTGQVFYCGSMGNYTSRKDGDEAENKAIPLFSTQCELGSLLGSYHPFPFKWMLESSIPIVQLGKLRPRGVQ